MCVECVGLRKKDMFFLRTSACQQRMGLLKIIMQIACDLL